MVNIGKARNPVNQSGPQLVVTSIKGEAVQDPNIMWPDSGFRSVE